MTVFSPSGTNTSANGPAPQGERIPHNLRQSACERLVSGPNRTHAARNLIASAESHGIDLNLLWGVIDRSRAGPALVRQTCLGVLGAGATAMLFHSSPENARSLGSNATQCAEIAEPQDRGAV